MMTVLVDVFLILSAAFLMVWGFNLSFSAHLMESNKQLWWRHGLSFLVILASLCLLAVGLYGSG